MALPSSFLAKHGVLFEAGPEVIKLFSCSTPLRIIFPVLLLINIKMPTTVGILTFMSGKNNILGYLSIKKLNFLMFYTYDHLNFHVQLS